MKASNRFLIAAIAIIVLVVGGAALADYSLVKHPTARAGFSTADINTVDGAQDSQSSACPSQSGKEGAGACPYSGKATSGDCADKSDCPPGKECPSARHCPMQGEQEASPDTTT